MSEYGDDHLDLSFLDNVAEDTVATQRFFREYLSAFYVFVKSCLVFEINKSTLHNACTRMADVANRVREEVEGATIEFMADGVYVNRDLVKLDTAGFEQGEYLYQIWKVLEIGEVEATGATSMEDWLGLATEFKRVISGGVDKETFHKLNFPNIRLVAMTGMAGDEDLTVTDRFRALRAHSITTVALSDMIEKARIGGRLRVVTVKRPIQR